MKKTVFNKFIDGMYSYNNFYKTFNICPPRISLTCYDEFLSVADKEYFKFCSEKLHLKFKDRKEYCFYLFIISFQGNYSNKIFDYYKIWKNQNINVPMIEKGIEKKCIINKEAAYISCGTFDLDNITEVLIFLFKNQKRAFILCSKKRKLQKCTKIYDELTSLENQLDENDFFGLKKLFEEMTEGEIFVNVSSDGELIGVNIFEKNKC